MSSLGLLFILSEFEVFGAKIKFTPSLIIFSLNSLRVGDEALYWETESRAFKLDNDYYEGSMSAIVSDLDDDDDVFNCYVTFGNLPLNLTTQLISSAMRTDSGSFCSIILAPLILTSLLGYLKPFF